MSRPRLPRAAALALLASTACLAQPAARNLAPNPSFELAPKGKLLRWSCHEGRAKAAFVVDDTVARSGRRSLRIVNSAKRSPHVYSHVEQRIDVLPRRSYTLSCYVKSDDAGVAWIGGGRKWRIRFPFPRKTRGWQRVTGTFETAADERSFRLLILSESPTQALWVDDVQVEEGSQATRFVATLPLEPGQTLFTISPKPLGPNLAPNSSFEAVHGNRPQFWMFDRRNTDATMTVDDMVARSGRRSVKLTNGTRFGPHVYGWLGVGGGIAVKPSTPYTVSAYVKSDSPGMAWIGGARRWRCRCKFAPTKGEWMRFSRSFTTEADETNIPFMIITESPTDGFWVDDVKLDEGGEATPYLSEGAGASPLIDLAPRLKPARTARGRSVLPYWAPSKYPVQGCVFTPGGFRSEGIVYLPEDLAHATVRAQILRERGVDLDPSFVVVHSQHLPGPQALVWAVTSAVDREAPRAVGGDGLEPAAGACDEDRGPAPSHFPGRRPSRPRCVRECGAEEVFVAAGPAHVDANGCDV